MYLVSMDVDTEENLDARSSQGGSLAASSNRLVAETTSHIGPLNEGLNAICTPPGYCTSKLIKRIVNGLYGPNSLSYFSWNPALGMSYPNGSHAALGMPLAPLPAIDPYQESTQSTRTTTVDRSTLPIRQITWSDASGLYRRFHYANTLNGAREYRVEHRPLWSDALAWRTLSPTESSTPSQLDRSIYETIFALPKDQCLSIQYLWNAARHSGLIQYPTVTTERAGSAAELEDLNRRRAHVVKEIEYFDRLPISDRTYSIREDLRNQQRKLRRDIDLLQASAPSEYDLREQRHLGVQREQWQREHLEATRRVEQLSGQLLKLRQEQKQLTEELHLLNRTSKAPVTLETTAPIASVQYRERLAEIDKQLEHWHRTLAEIVLHRQQLEQSATHLRAEKQYDLPNSAQYADPREPLRALENQILQTRRQLEDLLQTYSHGTKTNTYVDASLPATLKSMQENLYEVCRQISRKESDSAFRQLGYQIEQLSRCEKELQAATEKLLQDRRDLLNRVATELGVSLEQLRLQLPYGCGCSEHSNSLQCHADHRVLESRPAPRSTHDEAIEDSIRGKLRDVESQIRQLQGDHAAALVEVKRLEDRLAETPVVRLFDYSRITELQADLEKVEQRLRHWDRMDELRAELRELDRRISECRQHESCVVTSSESTLHQDANKWFEILTSIPGQAVMGRQLPLWARDQEMHHDHPYARMSYGLTPMQIPALESISSRSIEEYRLVTLAIRFAIAEALSARGENVPLLIDDCWAELSVASARQLMTALAQIARRGVQVVLFTADARVVALARSHQGYVCHVRPVVERPVEVVVAPEVVHAVNPVPVVDHAEVNRRLHAIADEQTIVIEPKATEAKVIADPSPLPPLKRTKVKTYYVDGRGPFYLSRSSRIEEAPSIDDAMAERLRKIGVSSVGCLLDANCEKVAVKLEDTSDSDYFRHQGSNLKAGQPSRYVSAKRVARWQAECRLVCEVPNVRAFDSRVMVGCGIRGPKQLSRLTPNQLARRVQRFLQTERGKQVLRSGSGYEVARITSWIVEANSDRRPIRSARVPSTVKMQSPRRDREAGNVAEHRQSSRVSTGSSGDRKTLAERKLQRRMRRRLERREVEQEQTVKPRERKREESVRTVASLPKRDVGAVVPMRGEVKSRVSSTADGAEEAVATSETATRSKTKVLKFYLSQDRPVVDAPSIGPKVAQRLNNIGIFTVRDFLQADSESLASRLGGGRFSGEVIRQWQQQCQLVCRIPELRGHDAQLLVMAGINSPERLAKSNAKQLFDEVSKIANSSEGKRVLRGASIPDLAEVKSWIESAHLCRPLAAA